MKRIILLILLGILGFLVLKLATAQATEARFTFPAPITMELRPESDYTPHPELPNEAK